MMAGEREEQVDVRVAVANDEGRIVGDVCNNERLGAMDSSIQTKLKRPCKQDWTARFFVMGSHLHMY